MDLGQGTCCQGLLVYNTENIVQRPFERLFQYPHDLFKGNRGDAVLQFFKFFNEFGRQQIPSQAQDLAKFNKGGAQLFQGVTQPLPGSHLRNGNPGLGYEDFAGQLEPFGNIIKSVLEEHPHDVTEASQFGKSQNIQKERMEKV